MSTFTLHFEDHGQDFLRWVCDAETGRILDAQPFQAWLWADGKKAIEPRSIEIGEPPFYYNDPNSDEDGRFLKYAVTRVDGVVRA